MYTVQKEESYPLNVKRTLLAMVLGSVGSKQYRCLYVDTPNGPEDIIGDGDLACAFLFHLCFMV